MIMCVCYKKFFWTKISNLLHGIFSQNFSSCGLKVQNSRFKNQKEKYENAISKNITDSRKLIQCVCSSPIIKLSFDTKVGTLLHRKFSQKFLLL